MLTSEATVARRSSVDRQPPSPERSDVVYTFSYMTWHGAARRGWFMPEDRLVHSLLADRRVGRLLVADTLRRLPAKLMPRRGSRADSPRLDPDDRLGRVEPVRLLNARPTSLRGVERAFRRYDRQLRVAAARMGLNRPAVITANPLAAGFADFSWARSVTFYAVDDWTRSPLYQRWWPMYEEAYRRIGTRRLRVAAVSPALRDRLAPPEQSVLVSNGLEPTEWVGAGAPPEWSTGDSRPLLVYAGTLDARLDVSTLLDLAQALPDARIVLVGPVGDSATIAAVRAAANIEIRPRLDRIPYAGLLRRADVGLIPHVRSELTFTIEPQKVYEYLAGGLPVVSLDVPPIRGISERVRLVDAHGDFAGQVRAALAAGRATETDRLAFVEANSWRARHERLIGLAVRVE